MKALKKYKDNLEVSNLTGKLASYSAMAAAFAAFAPDAEAQCPAGAVVDANAPILQVDINNDGTPDLDIVFSNYVYGSQTFLGTATPATNGLPWAGLNGGPGSFAPGFNTQVSAGVPFTGALNANPLQTNWYVNTFNPGTFGPPNIFGTPGVIYSYSLPIVYSQYIRNVSYFGTITNGVSINYALAFAAPGNQIVGLASGSDVCGLLPTTSIGGTNTGALLNAGYSVYSDFYSYFNQTLLFAGFNGAFVFQSAFSVVYANGYYGSYYGGNPTYGAGATGLGNFYSVIQSGPFVNDPPKNTLAQGNLFGQYQIGVQFSGPDLDGDNAPDTYYGWVTLQIDPNTSAMTVVGCDYNTCSIEAADANSAAGAAGACIAVGEADPNPGDCAPCPEITGIAANMTDYCAGDDIVVTLDFGSENEIVGGEDIQVNGVGPDAPIAQGDLTATFTLSAAAVHDGTTCAAQQVNIAITTSLCDDGVTAIDIDPAVMAFDVDVWTPATLTLVANDCGPSVMVAPADCVVANDYDANGATPDFAAEMGAGTVTFTVTQDPLNPCPAPQPVMANFDCSMPSCTIDAINEVAAACDDQGTPDGADDMVTITIDPAGTSNDGLGVTAPLAGTYAVTGLPGVTMGTFGTPLMATVPADGMTYTIEVTYTDPVDGFTCTEMVMVTVDGPCSTPAPTFTFAISDPCACNNDEELDGDGNPIPGTGTFSETLEAMGPAGFALCLATGATGAIDDAGNPILPGTPEAMLTEIPNGDGTSNYVLEFNHADGVGYMAAVAICGDEDNPVTPVVENTCHYPVIATDADLPTTLCSSDAPVDLTAFFSENSGDGDFEGVFSFSGSGVSGDMFDPAAAAAGDNDITVTYTPGVTVGTTPDVDADPALCATTVTETISIESVTVTVDDVSCDDNDTPDMVDDDVTTITVTVSTDGAGTTFMSDIAPDGQGTINLPYGTYTYTVNGGAGLSVTITDEDGGNCTATIDEATGCITVENIPTVGEWGLIMLGLMMSITAVVGIRQRREEEVVA